MRIISYVQDKIVSIKKEQIKNKINSDVALTDTQITELMLWYYMFIGQAPWCLKSVNSLRLENGICREFSNTALSEIETNISDEILNNSYQNAIDNLNAYLQIGLALGSFVIKPLNETAYQFVNAYNYMPITYNSQGMMTSVVFLDRRYINTNKWYIRTEKHILNEEKQLLTIEQKVFQSSDGSTLGKQIPLNILPDWATLQPSITYRGVTSPLYGYYHNPIAIVGGNFNASSIYANAIELIKKADIQSSRLDWEYEASEKAIFVEDNLIMTDKRGRKNLSQIKERLYRSILTDTDNPIKEYSPSIRDDNFLTGLEEYKRQIEFNVGLAYGDLSRIDNIEKTATEVMASKERKHKTIKAIQHNLKYCLEDLARAFAFYQRKYNSNYEFVCDFHDNILIDEEKERAKDLEDVRMQIMSPVEYRMKYYHETREEAEKNIPDTLDIGSIE